MMKLCIRETVWSEFSWVTFSLRQGADEINVVFQPARLAGQDTSPLSSFSHLLRLSQCLWLSAQTSKLPGSDWDVLLVLRYKQQ